MATSSIKGIPVANPFTPGFGQVPVVMAGRSEMLDDIRRALDTPGFSPDLATLFVGARGSGKTAMLSYVSELAESTGWVSASVSAVPGMLEDILEQTRTRAAHLLDESTETSLSGIHVGDVLGLEWERKPSQQVNWRTSMSEMLDQLARRDVGLLITVDEVRPTLDEMIQLASVYQHFVREGRRVALMLAGLPAKISALLTDDSVSFLRRAQYRRLGRVADHEVADAFERTAREGGRKVGRQALNEAVEAIDGFPYMLQLVGYRTWQRGTGSDRITVDEVRDGIRMARADIREKILQTTYSELSDGDLRFVEAMMRCEGPVTLAAVAAQMGVRSNYASKYKSRLMEQGVISEGLRKELRFELPMFSEFVREMMG